jgi:hypothetical protein
MLVMLMTAKIRISLFKQTLDNYKTKEAAL